MSRIPTRNRDSWHALPVEWAILVLVAGIVLLAFWPARTADFVNWDDDRILVQNTAFRGLGTTELQWMFTTFHAGHYQPLTWLSYAVDCRLGGLDANSGDLDPQRFHSTNLWLHAGGAVVFFFLARRLLRASVSLAMRPYTDLSAAFAALLFAVHPLRVESVAWITERRDVLSGVFFFAAVLAYIMAAESSTLQRRRYAGFLAASVLLYTLSLLSKAAALAMPLLLVMLDVYPLRRLGGRRGWFLRAGKRVWLEKLPYVALAIAAGVAALTAQSSAQALHSLDEHDIASRLAQAAHGLIFYLQKTFHPFDLGPIYEIPARDVLLGGLWVYGTVLLAVTIALFLLRRRWPSGWIVWLAYAALLAPVLGLAQSGRQFAADRYSYLACTGLALLGGGGLLRCLQAHQRGDVSSTFTRVVGLSAVLAIAVLAALANLQTRVWHDSVSLWRQGVAVSPRSAVAHVNLADAIAGAGDYQEAIPHYRAGLEIDRSDALAHNGLGVALLRSGQPNLAMERFRLAVELKPDYAGARANLAFVLAGFGQLDTAADEYEHTIRLDPDLADARLTLARLHQQRGRSDRSALLLSEGVSRHPMDMRFAADLSWLRATSPDDDLRDGSEALQLAQRACRQMKTPDPWAMRTLAAALAESGRFAEALTTAEQAEQHAIALGAPELVEKLRRDRQHYEQNQPLREPCPQTRPARGRK